VPAKTKQVAVQPTRIVKQVVYRAPKPLTPAEQTAEVENIFATVITDKINKNIKGVKFKTSITKDGVYLLIQHLLLKVYRTCYQTLHSFLHSLRSSYF
jgi:hypothetical protein